MTSTAPLTAKPAKPYEGTAQHAAVRAAIARTHPDLRVVSDSFRMWVRVTGNGGVVIDGEFCKVASISVCRPMYSSRTVTNEQVAEVKASITAALVAAGWTVTTDRSGQELNVYGPGIAEWVARKKAARARENEARITAERGRQAQREEAARIVEALGFGYVATSTYSTKIEFTVDQARRLLALVEARRDEIGAS